MFSGFVKGVSFFVSKYVLDIPSFESIGLGTFVSAGYNYFTKQVVVEDGVKFNLPNSLKYIGIYGFASAYIDKIDLSNKRGKFNDDGSTKLVYNGNAPSATGNSSVISTISKFNSKSTYIYIYLSLV